MIQDNATGGIWPLYTAMFSDSTSLDIDSISIGTGGSAFWFYEASRGSVRRSGYLNTTWNSDGTNAELVTLSTDESPEHGVGDSSDLTIEAVVESENVILRATYVNDWTIKYKRLQILGWML